jgi:hypothetical protein
MGKELRNSIQENFGLVATFLGFVIDSITLIALINSKIPPSIPFIEYELDATFQLILWDIALVTFFGFLRERWLRISRKLSTRPESKFSRFIIYDLIFRFKYPFLLIPFIFFLGILFPILAKLSFSGWVFLVISGIIVLFSIAGALDAETAQQAKNKLQLESEREWSLLRNEQVYYLWTNRIEKEMAEKGYATNLDLANLYAEPVSYCNKALWQYHDDFEIEKDLICVSKLLESRYGESKKILRLWVVASRELADSRPWLTENEKYFSI